jgi:hypothetical protein
MSGPTLVKHIDNTVQALGFALVLAVVRKSAHVIAQDEDRIGGRPFIGRRDLDHEEPHGPTIGSASILENGQVATRVPDQQLDLDIPGAGGDRVAGQ